MDLAWIPGPLLVKEHTCHHSMDRRQLRWPELLHSTIVQSNQEGKQGRSYRTMWSQPHTLCTYAQPLGIECRAAGQARIAETVCLENQ